MFRPDGRINWQVLRDLMENAGQREVASERRGQNREAITLMDNCLGPGAFARSFIYNNLEILISLCPHFTVKEIEVQRGQDTQKREECESGINTSLYICPGSGLLNVCCTQRII